MKTQAEQATSIWYADRSQGQPVGRSGRHLSRGWDAVRSVFRGCLLIVLLVGFARNVQAQFLLPSLSLIATNNAVSGTNFGYRITVGASDLTVYGLGYWAYQSRILNTEQAGIWDSSHALVASATFSPTTGTTIGGYFYVGLPSPVVLLAGQAYTIAGTIVGSETFPIANATLNGATLTTSKLDTTAAGFNEPMHTTGGIGSTYLVNLSFAAIPEPSTYGMIGGLSSLAVAWWRRRRGENPR